MSSPFFQSLDPQSPPSPVTPADTPSDASGYASVAVQPMNIQAPSDEAAVQAAYDGAGVAAAGVSVYPSQGPRQQEAAALLNSPQGSGAMDVTAGFTGGGGESWPGNPNPIPTAQTPIQGSGDFTGTGTD